MLLSRKWLNEFVEIDINDHDFSEEMTLSGSKVETTQNLGAELTNVVVGKVLGMKTHENSDHMWVCQVDVGEASPVQIVTGAQNVQEGDLVPVAKDGSTLPGGIEIKASELRGETSFGMLCSLQELNLTQSDFPDAIEEGIFILNNEHCTIGQDIREVIGVMDSVVEFEITPNRPDCLSVMGLAREAAATFGKELKLHEPVVRGGGAGNLLELLNVEVAAEDL
ncbi:MAG: Phenylalanyl-tRNA synthetase beta chain, partial [Evtepia sp.]|nr:Phenylalanyl-tRNA synthetase beta chain [Evtepia sp.]